MIIRLFIFLTLTLSCSHLNHSQKRVIANSNDFDYVIAFGATTQGNGYNWAATLSWLAVKLADTVEQAKVIEQSGQKVGIKIINFSGGSSGSAVTMLFDAFLKNKRIISSRPETTIDRILTIEDATKLSKSLTFTAMSFDFHWFYTASTFARGIKRRVSYILDKISDSIPIVPDLIGRGKMKLWSSRMSGRVVVADFAKFIHFASIVSWDQINEEIVWQSKEFKKLHPEIMQSKEAQDIVNSLTHFYSLPLVSSPVDLPKQDLEKLRKITQAQSKAARRVLNKVTGKNFKKFKKNRRFYRLYTSKPKTTQKKEQSNPLRQVMSSPMGPGVMTITMAASYKSKKEMKNSVKKHGLPYKNLRPYVFMSEETAEKLISSHEYQKLVKNKESFLDRYIFAVVDQKWAGINPSVREPGLLGELAGKLAGEDFRIRKVYDPRVDDDQSFQLINIEDYEKKYMFVAGGFPYQEMTAIPSALYFINEVEKLNEKYPRVKPIYHLFGHPLNKTSPTETFAGRCLQGVFNESRSEEEFQTSMNDWNRWIKKWKSHIVNKLFPKYSILNIETLYNWSTGALPAALTGGSRILVQNSAVMSSKTNIVQRLHGIYSLYPPKDPKHIINQKPKD